MQLSIESELGVGTTITATFQHSHIDRAPLGDIAGSIMAVLLSERAVDVAYRHVLGNRQFELDTAEVRAELGEVPLTHPEVREWLENELANGLASLSEQQA